MNYLRDYQETIKQAVMAELANGSQSTLFVQPTGTGKTQVALSVIEDWPDKDCIKLGIAHRQELIYQPWNRWHDITGEYADLEMADQRRSGRSNVVFASKDSLHPRRLRESFPDPRAVGLLWIDECHHCISSAKSYAHILDYFASGNPDLRIMGCTATPDRADEEALGQVFGSVAAEFPLLDPTGGPSAIGDGWLVDIAQEIVTVDGIDFKHVGSRGGDFIDGQLQRMLLENRAVEKIVGATRDIAQGRTTLLFTTGVEQAIQQALILNGEEDGCARAIVSRLPDGMDYSWVIDSQNSERRQQALKQWSRGQFAYFCNVGVFTEGMDEPKISVISMGRPTKSRSLYSQMMGRGMRVLPGVIEGPQEDDWWRLDSAEKRRAAIQASGKPSLLVLDFVGVSQHSLIHAADVLGGKYPDEVVARAKRKINKGEKDVQRALAEAEEDEERDRKLRMRQAVRSEVSARRVRIDPFAVLNIVSTREPGWHKGRQPTHRMAEALRKFKIDEDVIGKLSFHKASQLLDRLIGRVKQSLCTYKQARLLAQHGFNPDVSFEQASQTIDQIKRKKLPSVDQVMLWIQSSNTTAELDGNARQAQRMKRLVSPDQWSEIVQTGSLRRVELGGISGGLHGEGQGDGKHEISIGAG